MKAAAMLGKWLVVGALVAAAACDNVDHPPCSFACGPSSACPDDYTCQSDGYCHLDGTSSVCPYADASVAVLDGSAVVDAGHDLSSENGDLSSAD